MSNNKVPICLCLTSNSNLPRPILLNSPASGNIFSANFYVGTQYYDATNSSGNPEKYYYDINTIAPGQWIAGGTHGFAWMIINDPPPQIMYNQNQVPYIKVTIQDHRLPIERKAEA